MTDIANELYDQLGPHKEEDALIPEHPLLDLAEACIGGLQPMEDVIRDDDDGPGWSKVMDPDRAPAEWLDWLSQFGGGRIPEGATEEAKREHIKTVPSFRRGGPKALEDAIKAQLDPSTERKVYIRERDGDAYHTTIATRTSETPDEAKVLAAILTQKPGGIVYTYFTVTGGDYGTLFASSVTYNEIFTEQLTYADVLLNPEGTP
jgi:hypothetical protein